ncbi:hypothetical protein K501DRAFT_280887, partial [Backusella circina FSU 941]
MAKIIVYGFVFSTHSETKPTFQDLWLRLLHKSNLSARWKRERGTDEETVSLLAPSVYSDDDDSSYTQSTNSFTPSRRNIPAFASSSFSSGNSGSPSQQPYNSGSGSSVYSDTGLSVSIPPWVPSGHDQQQQKQQQSPHLSTASIRKNLSPTQEHIKKRTYANSQAEEEEEGDNISIFSNAEQDVLVSLGRRKRHVSAVSTATSFVANDDNESYHNDFLKVNHGCFLSSTSNIMDLIAVTSYWIDTIMIIGFHSRPYSIFQAFSATRLLRFLVITEGTSVIMTSLRSSYDMLKNVLGFFVFFWLLFSLVALFIFMNAFSRRCAVLPDGAILGKGMKNISYVEPRTSCSGHYISATEKTGAFDVDTGYQYLQSVGDGMFCKLGQVCIQDVLNQPEWGYMTFDNIFYAMLNIFTVISTENWTDMLYISQDSVSSVGSALFYSFCIYMMTFIMVPMFIAVITTSFSHIRGDMRESAFSVKRKTRLLLTFGRKRQNSSAQGGDEHHDDWIYERANNTNNLQQTDSSLQRISSQVVNSFWFPYIGSVLVVGNVICMTFFSSDIPSKQKNILVTLIDEIPISDVIGDGQGILNLTFFTFLVLLLLAPISVQLFGGDFNFVESDEPSMRFDNSYQAFLALFQ